MQIVPSTQREISSVPWLIHLRHFHSKISFPHLTVQRAAGQYQSSVVNWLTLSNVLFKQVLGRDIWHNLQGEVEGRAMESDWCIIWKEHREMKPLSLVYLGSSSLPTLKWRDALWTTHLWAAFDVPFYSPGPLWAVMCVRTLKILQCSLQDQWNWPISHGLLSRTATETTSFCFPGLNALLFCKRNEN